MTYNIYRPIFSFFTSSSERLAEFRSKLVSLDASSYLVNPWMNVLIQEEHLFPQTAYCQRKP